MQTRTKQILGIALAVALIAGTAGATAFLLTKHVAGTQEAELSPYDKGYADGKAAAKTKHVTHSSNWVPPAGEVTAPAPQQQVAVRCQRNNILGTIVGAAGGGLAGSAIGKGNGKTAATVGGALGGAYLGGKYLPLDSPDCS